MKLIIFLCLVTFVVAAKKDHETRFKDFLKAHRSGGYKNAAEMAKKKEHHRKNWERIDNCNDLFAAGKIHYECGENHLTDMAANESIAMLCASTPSMITARALPQIIAQPLATSYAAGAASKDWTSSLRTSVSDQKVKRFERFCF